MPVVGPVAAWLALEVVAPDAFTRAVDAIRSTSELSRLYDAVHRDVGLRPGRGFRRWAKSDSTWVDLVDRTNNAYERLIDTLAHERARRLLGARASDTETARRLVDATLGHFVSSLEPSRAISVVGHRLDQRLGEIAQQLDARTEFEGRLTRLPPGVRLALTDDAADRPQAERLVSAVTAKSPLRATKALLADPPTWLRNASAHAQLATAELAEAHGLTDRAVEFFTAAADSGLDRAYLYARAAKAAIVSGDAALSGSLIERARAVGGGPVVDFIDAAIADDATRMFAALSMEECLSSVTLSLLYATALRSTGDLDGATALLTRVAETHPEFSGPVLELGWTLAQRALNPDATSRAADRARVMDLALQARGLRREWGGDAGSAVHLACATALMTSNFEAAVRLGATPPDGEAWPSEAEHPEVRYAVFEAALAIGKMDLAHRQLEGLPHGFQRVLFAAELLRLTGGDVAAVASAFHQAWGLATREEDRAAVWFGAAHAGLDPLPGEDELNGRTDDLPVLVRSQVDISCGRLEEAAVRLRTRPASEACARELAHALVSASKIDEAVAELQIAADRFHNPDHLYAAARVLAEHGRLDDATAIGDGALARLSATFAAQRSFLHQIGIRAAHGRNAWREMAARVRAWIDDQGPTASRRWLLVQALHNDGAFGAAWGAVHEAPELEPETVLHAQLWIALSSRFRPGPDLVAQILEIHERFGADPSLTITAVNAFVNMGDDKGDLPPDVVERFQALIAARAAQADEVDDTFVQMSVPDSVEGLIETFRPHLEPQAIRMEAMTTRVADGWPYGLLSATAGRSYTSALVQRGAGCLPVTAIDQPRAEAELSTASGALGSAVAVDVSAFTTAWYLRAVWPALRGAFSRLELASPSRHDIVVAVDSLTPRPSGYMTWDTRSGRPVMTEADPAEIDRIEEHTRWVNDVAELVTIREWPRLTMDEYQFRDDPRFLPWLASVDLARANGLPLWADDLGLRTLARDAGVSTFGTVALVAALVNTGALTGSQERSALRTLREEYCVDLPLDPDWVRSSAGASEWEGGAAALGFARGATWASPGVAFVVWRDVITGAAAADPTLVARWLYAACVGLLKAFSGGPAEQLVVSLVGRALTSIGTDKDAFASCVEASRQACNEAGAADPAFNTLRMYLDFLAETFGPPEAAALLSQLGERLEGTARDRLRAVLFAVNQQP